MNSGHGAERASAPAFEPTHAWQGVPEGAVLPPGLMINVDLRTDRTRARLAPGDAICPVCLLSIRTVFPRKGGRIWYDDQSHVHQQIFAGEEELHYAFTRSAPWRRNALAMIAPHSCGQALAVTGAVLHVQSHLLVGDRSRLGCKWWQEGRTERILAAFVLLQPGYPTTNPLKTLIF